MSHHLLMEYRAVYGEDESGRSVSMYEIIRNTSLVPAILGGITWIYSVIRLAARRGHDFN